MHVLLQIFWLPMNVTPVPTALANKGLLATIYRWLFDHSFDAGFHRQVERFIATLIVVSVLAVVAEHIPALYDPYAEQFHWPQHPCIPTMRIIALRACAISSVFMPWLI
jgi:hypothetical protein